MEEIKIINIFGQFYQKGTDHYYTYFNGNPLVESKWKQYINDPRILPKEVTKCYALWCTNEGWWISALTRHLHDDRGGLAEVAFCLGANRPSDGNSAVNFLEQALDFFIVSRPVLTSSEDVLKFDKRRFWNDDETIEWLRKHPLSLVPCQLRVSTLSGMLGNPAYRTYRSGEDLSVIMSAISQNGCEKFSRIFVVDEQFSTAMEGKATCVNKIYPIRRIFKVVLPNDSNYSVDKTEVNEGESITITYKKEGYQPYHVSDIVSANSRYGKVTGNSFNVNNINEAGIAFYKLIYLHCVNEAGTKISDVIIDNQRGTVDNETGCYRIQIYPKKENVINIRHNDYNPITIQLKDSDIQDGMQREVKLVAKGYTVKFHAGRYCFYAKEAVKAGSSEYRELIKYGKLSSDNEIKVILTPLLNNPNPSSYGNHNEIHDMNDSQPKRTIKRYVLKGLKWSTITIVSMYIIYALICLFCDKCPFPFGKTTTSDKPHVGQPYPCNHQTCECPNCSYGDQFGNCTCSCAGCKQKEGAKEDKQEDISADIEYLKKESTWSKNALKSQKYKQLMDHLKNGQIEDIVSREWFEESDPTSGYWHTNRNDGIFDMLKQINEGSQVNKDRACQLLKNSFQGDQLQLSFLKSELAKLCSVPSIGSASSMSETTGGRREAPVRTITTPLPPPTNSASQTSGPRRELSH